MEAVTGVIGFSSAVNYWQQLKPGSGLRHRQLNIPLNRRAASNCILRSTCAYVSSVILIRLCPAAPEFLAGTFV